MNKTYSKINWKNSPATSTPLNAANLSTMDNAIDTIDNRVVNIDGRVTSLDSSVSDLDDTVELIDGKVSNLITSVTNLDTEKLDIPATGELLVADCKLNSSGTIMTTNFTDGTSQSYNITGSGGGGGGGTITPVEVMEQVWVNPDLESMSGALMLFEAQTISIDLSDYDFIEIYYAQYSQGDITFGTTIFYSAKTIIRSDYTNLPYTLSIPAAQSSNNKVYSRKYIVSTSGIQFFAGYSNTNSDDSACVPVWIYGGKFASSSSSSSVTVTPKLAIGTEIATIKVNEDSTTLYAPAAPSITVTPKVTSGTEIGTVNVGGDSTKLYAPAASVVTVTQALTSGTEIGTVSVDGTPTKLYAPSSGSGGSAVSISDTRTSGVSIGTITIDGVSTNLYAPSITSPTGLVTIWSNSTSQTYASGTITLSITTLLYSDGKLYYKVGTAYHQVLGIDMLFKVDDSSELADSPLVTVNLQPCNITSGLSSPAHLTSYQAMGVTTNGHVCTRTVKVDTSASKFSVIVSNAYDWTNKANRNTVLVPVCIRLAYAAAYYS